MKRILHLTLIICVIICVTFTCTSCRLPGSSVGDDNGKGEETVTAERLVGSWKLLSITVGDQIINVENGTHTTVITFNDDGSYRVYMNELSSGDVAESANPETSSYTLKDGVITTRAIRYSLEELQKRSPELDRDELLSKYALVTDYSAKFIDGKLTLTYGNEDSRSTSTYTRYVEEQ